MILRFALVPVVANAFLLPLLFIFYWDGNETALELSPLQYAAIVPWSIAGWTWFGWGLAFWRFDRSEIPVRSFLAYPTITGLTVVPVFWVLASAGPDPDMSDYVAATIFGVFAGPLQAVLVATACRYLPQAVALRRSRD
jgi:hypothetical protein